jgi:hypothetical protein
LVGGWQKKPTALVPVQQIMLYLTQLLGFNVKYVRTNNRIELSVYHYTIVRSADLLNCFEKANNEADRLNTKPNGWLGD